MTIEDLAEMIQRTMASKEDFATVKKDIAEVTSLQKDMLGELHATHGDVRYVRNTVSMLVQGDAAHEAAIAELKTRVYRLEQKAGLTQ
ncbi:MAG: hypothetical protein AAB916_02425 [Patescibacteria group bacterium]